MGASDLHLEPHAEGRPYLQMQAFLSGLQADGIPLCVASKNEDEVARTPFRERSEMLLSEDDFVYFYASWNNKSQVVRRIAADLQLGLDAICFLDDSPHEREEVRRMAPGTIVPELPDDPECRVGALVDTGLFLKTASSDEDRRRAEMYKAHAQRQSERGKFGSVDDYLKSLGMTLDVLPVDKSTPEDQPVQSDRTAAERSGAVTLCRAQRHRRVQLSSTRPNR